MLARFFITVTLALSACSLHAGLIVSDGEAGEMQRIEAGGLSVTERDDVKTCPSCGCIGDLVADGAAPTVSGSFCIGSTEDVFGLLPELYVWCGYRRATEHAWPPYRVGLLKPS